MKKVILLLGFALSISIASCSKEESTVSNDTNSQTKNGEVLYKSKVEPVVGETVEIMSENEEFETQVEPVVGETYDVIADDEDDKDTYGTPIKVKIICKRDAYVGENGDYIGEGVDASGQHWVVTWDYSLQPSGLYTLKLTAKKLAPGAPSPC